MFSALKNNAATGYQGPVKKRASERCRWSILDSRVLIFTAVQLLHATRARMEFLLLYDLFLRQQK